MMLSIVLLAAFSLSFLRSSVWNGVILGFIRAEDL